ncbi:MAG: nanoRNase/pAp phosphatase (c-di-AMP/oligoRNAs hydrolase) [Planctomycetota bacterium]|jgi:nanoRNase/pAp phosphatase (c-di-AMP/oligoRNAs hydrolase)
MVPYRPAAPTINAVPWKRGSTTGRRSSDRFMTDIHPKPTEAQAGALELLRASSSFLLVGHMRPDGDCIGAQVALARVLIAMGKSVAIMNPDSPDAIFGRITEGLGFAAHVPGSGVPEHDVCVLLDINDLSRCGSMEAPLLEAASPKLVVDHHVAHGGEWWDAAFIDVTASATGVLVARVAAALGVELDPLAAEAVFTAVVTDTGWLKYSNTDEETVSLVAQLVSLGVVPSEVYDGLYQRNAPELPHAIAAVLSHLKYHCRGRLAVVEHPLASIPGAFLGDADPVLDVVRAVAGVEVVLYLRELENGNCKLSARSKTEFDVNALARQFGGGGHRKASGATIPGTLPDVGLRITKAAARMLGESGPPQTDGAGAA